MPDMPPIPPQGAQAPPEQAEGEGMSVTIDKRPDGTLTVSQNPGEPQPAASIDEALNTAKQMLGGAPDDRSMMEKSFQQAAAQG